MDYWRRAGLGQMAEVFGSNYVERDRAARLLLYRGDMVAEWASYGPSARASAEAFAAGVNAFIDLATLDPARLPPEFAALGYLPGRWSADDAVRVRMHGMWQNADSEIQRSQLACQGLLAGDPIRRKLEPPRALVVPEGLDPCDLSPEVMRVVRLAASPTPAKPDGSNNWAIAGNRTATGRPILASDPHRGYDVPALRYVVHLRAPGLDVIGAGEPHMPGVALGHNGQVAFGFTIFPADQEDIVVLQLHPTDDRQYRYGDAWRSFESETQSIAVKDKPAEAVTLEYSVHGPVLHRDAAKRRAYALQSVAFEPGGAPYYGQLASMRANTVESFDQALAAWGAPGEHHVFADARDIGWRSAAKTPIRRPGADGLFPMPADGKPLWNGFYAMDAMPGGRNPEKGWISTANNILDAETYPYADRAISYEWMGDARARRIDEVIAASSSHTVADSVALQSDTVSLIARDIVAVLAAAKLTSKAAIAAREQMLNWDFDFAATSQTAALFQVWYYGQVEPGLVRMAGIQKLRPAFLLADERTILERLAKPDASVWGKDPVAARDQFLDSSLVSAERDLGLLFLGKPQSERTWGALLKARWKHKAAKLLPKALRDATTLPVTPSGGDLTTVGLAAFDKDFNLIYGASFRMVIDVGGWDNSVFVNAPGQSGDPRNPHFKDHFGVWAEGRALPLLYSNEAIEQSNPIRLKLTPAAKRE